MTKTLYLIRHAKAEDRALYVGKNDSLRPLTDKGKEKFASSLKKLKKKKFIIKESFHSPFLRCKQSAEILEKVFKIKSHPSPMLAHGEDPAMSLKLLFQAKDKTAFIGHEPELSIIYNEILGLKGDPFKKGELRKIKIQISGKKIV